MEYFCNTANNKNKDYIPYDSTYIKKCRKTKLSRKHIRDNMELGEIRVMDDLKIMVTITQLYYFSKIYSLYTYN